MSTRSVALRTLVTLLVIAALPAGAGAAARTRGHPPTGGEQDCAACHRTRTRASFEAWERSPHGIALVTCVVCHGSAGADFRAKPAAVGCGGCHAAQADSVAKRAVSDCWACHAHHSLSTNPHR